MTRKRLTLLTAGMLVAIVAIGSCFSIGRWAMLRAPTDAYRVDGLVDAVRVHESLLQGAVDQTYLHLVDGMIRDLELAKRDRPKALAAESQALAERLTAVLGKLRNSAEYRDSVELQGRVARLLDLLAGLTDTPPSIRA